MRNIIQAFLDFLQCQKYKGSEQIMKKAEYIYRKFRQYYLMGDGENVSNIYIPLFEES